MFFQGQYLNNHRQELMRMIEKLEAEAQLFGKLDIEEGKAFDEVFKDFKKIDEPNTKSAADRNNEMRRREKEIDLRARRTFALYANLATSNGYGLQAHLLRTKEIPRVQEKLAKIEKLITTFKLEVADESSINRYFGRWNWRGEAERVGMVDQYDFLYRLTSRLLHSTPMNIMTKNELAEDEQFVIFEYIVVAIQDALSAIDKFDFPGKINAVYMEIGESSTKSI